MKFTEARLEAAIIDLLGAEGYPRVLGEAIERQFTRSSDQRRSADLPAQTIRRRSL